MVKVPRYKARSRSKSGRNLKRKRKRHLVFLTPFFWTSICRDTQNKKLKSKILMDSNIALASCI